MRNPDDAIDRTLAALRDEKPPEGMDRRILLAVQQKTAQRRGSGPAMLPIPLRMPVLLGAIPYRAIALASVAIVSSAIFWTVSRPHTLSHQAPDEETHSTHDTHSTPATAPAPNPSYFEPTPTATEPSTQASIATAEQRTSPRRVRATPRKTLVALHDDLGSMNHPAPEAPLTGQEKLLLRLAHRSDPQEIALLNPSLWAANDAKEKEEVKKFFEPPPTGDDQ